MRILVSNYSFDASEKKVTFTDYNPIVIERVLLVTNITDNVIIYNFADPTKGGTAATNVLTLAYNTTTMDDADKLQIIYDDAATPQLVDLGTNNDVTQGTATNLKTQAEVYQGGSAVAVGNPLEVTLPAATVSTLTPPAAITGFATSAKQLPDNHQVTVSNIASTPLVDVSALATAAKQLPDGHTVALSATDNAVLDSLDTKLGTIDTAIDAINAKLVTGTDIGDVTINNSTGAAAVNIQDGGNTITVDGTVAVTNSDIASCKTALEVIDNAVSGTGFNESQINGVTPLMGNGTTGTGSQRVTIASDNTPFPVKTDQTTHGTTDKVAADITLIKGTATSVGNGTADNGCQRVTVASDNTAFPVKVASGGIASGAIASGAIASGAIASGAIASGAIATGAIADALADDAALSVGTSKTFPISMFADEASTDSVNEGDVGVPRMTLDRKQIVAVYPSATGEGLDIFRSIDLDESEEDVKTSAGKMFGYYIFNAAAATQYVKFYNATAANTTVGTTTPILTIPVPAGAAANCEFNSGIAFSTALCAAATTGVADNDTGAPATNSVVVNVFYK